MSALPNPPSSPFAVSYPAPVGLGQTVTPLSGMQRGDRGLIQAVLAQPVDSGRLQSMGLCVGRRVEVLRRADPMIVRVVGSRVGISAKVAAHIQVVAL